MAYSGKIIRNPQTGQSIQFLQTKKDTQGRLLEMESTYQAHSSEPVAHYHPSQAEDFVVLSGTLTVRLNGETKILRAGDTLHIPPNTVHGMWNPSDTPATVNWQVRPALDTEYLLETGMGLANAGKTTPGGRPPLLQSALTVRRFAAEYRLAKPSYAVQKVLFLLLTPFAYIFGYKPTYPQYLD